jgi:hypothetical protein
MAQISTQGVNDMDALSLDPDVVGPLEAEKARKEAALVREAELRERMVAALERIATAMEASP